MNVPAVLSTPRWYGSILATTIVFYGLIASCPAYADRAYYTRVLSSVRSAISYGNVVYSFDKHNPIPAGGVVLSQTAELYVINNASHAMRNDGQLRARILVDHHEGPEAGRCENDPAAVTTDGAKQEAELYTPAAAWSKLGGPALAFNVNYFDVRQQNGKTWQETMCGNPLGFYYDNHPGEGTKNWFDADGNTYFAGNPDYLNEKGEGRTAVDTFFIIDDNQYNDRHFLSFDLVRNGLGGGAATNRAKQLTNSGEYFVGFSGIDLLPSRGDGPADGESPDSGDSATTRIMIAYNKAADQLYLFRGGSYQNGVTRTDLSAIATSLGATVAMEIDGGGSAAVVVNPSKFTWAGASTTAPTGSCPDTGAVCSPITQPDGNPRPVPGWIGLTWPNPRRARVIDPPTNAAPPARSIQQIHHRSIVSQFAPVPMQAPIMTCSPRQHENGSCTILDFDGIYRARHKIQSYHK